MNNDETVASERSSSSENLPVLAGIEARIATQRRFRDRRPSQKAVMAALDSQPDLTSKEFTPKMRSQFMLRGPRPPDEPTEGRSTGHNTENIEDNTLEDSTPIAAASGTLLNIVSQSLQGINLPTELHGQYDQDPAFQPIIARPKDFHNFEVDGQLIYLKRQGGRVLCIPKIVINGRNA